MLMRWIVLIFTFFYASVVFTAEQTFCNTYDPAITHMHSHDVEPDTVYQGMPKRLSAEEFKNMGKVLNPYCPKCTLKDRNLCSKRPCQSYNLMPTNIYNGIQSKTDKWMQMANAEALKSVQNKGGPFGAVIVQIDDKTGKVIRYWANHNHVTEWTDPTAHAEITTIRTATRDLGVLDLGHINQKDAKLPQPSEWSHCVIYSSAEPCPMCLAAMYWAGIKNMAFSATRYDAAVEGVNFSDKQIYEESALPYRNRKYMYVVHANSDTGLDAFTYYKRNEVARYGGQQHACKQMCLIRNGINIDCYSGSGDNGNDKSYEVYVWNDKQ